MTKKEFEPLVEELLKSLRMVDRYDYYGVMRVIDQFELFVDKYSDHLNQYVLEHLDAIKVDFENARKYKDPKRKSRHWNYGMNGLMADIESMKRENKFPDS